MVNVTRCPECDGMATLINGTISCKRCGYNAKDMRPKAKIVMVPRGKYKVVI